jgi:hypothetical protein
MGEITLHAAQILKAAATQFTLDTWFVSGI